MGVSLRTVYNIKNNKTWKHLQEVGSITPQKLPKGGKTKVDESVAKEIKLKLMSGHKMNNIAKEYGVPFYVVYDIKYGKL